MSRCPSCGRRWKPGVSASSVLGTVRVRWCREQSCYDQDKWRGTWALDGGVPANQASHHVDLLEWMMGEVEGVYAMSATALVKIETEDTAVVTVRFRNGALAEKMAMLARHGGLVKGDHRIEGLNSRLDGLQAAGRDRVYHLYVVRHTRRDELKKFLAGRGIETVINYPVALPFLPAYAHLGAKPEDFPNAYRHQSMVLSLPIFPEMTEARQRLVIESITTFCKG